MNHVHIIVPVKRFTLAQKEEITVKIFEKIGLIYSHVAHAEQMQKMVLKILQKDSELRQPGSEEELLKQLEKNMLPMRSATENMAIECMRYRHCIRIYDGMNLAATKKILWECSQQLPGKLLAPKKLEEFVDKKVEMINLTIRQARNVRTKALKAVKRNNEQLEREMERLSTTIRTMDLDSGEQ